MCTENNTLIYDITLSGTKMHRMNCSRKRLNQEKKKKSKRKQQGKRNSFILPGCHQIDYEFMRILEMGAHHHINIITFQSLLSVPFLPKYLAYYAAIAAAHPSCFLRLTISIT